MEMPQQVLPTDTTDERRHVGIVVISKDTLLRWLQFEGGIVRDVRHEHRFNSIEVVIEHPDMPEVQEGVELTTVTPWYSQTTSECGHVTEVVRTHPKALPKDKEA